MDLRPDGQHFYADQSKSFTQVQGPAWRRLYRLTTTAGGSEARHRASCYQTVEKQGAREYQSRAPRRFGQTIDCLSAAIVRTTHNLDDGGHRSIGQAPCCRGFQLRFRAHEVAPWLLNVKLRLKDFVGSSPPGSGTGAQNATCTRWTTDTTAGRF